MDNKQAPRGRERNVTGQGKDVYRRGSGLGTGPVGSGTGRGSVPSGGTQQFRPNPAQQNRQSGQRSAGVRSAATKITIPIVILLIVAKIFFGGSGNGSKPETAQTPSGISSLGSSAVSETSSSDKTDYSSIFGSMYGYSYGGSASVSSGWTTANNTGTLNTSVAPGARAKYTALKGNGKDTVTVMLYMCGADLESKSGMATADLKEILTANIADNVNFIVYAGGCRQWKNTNFSNKTNQIYQLLDGGKLRTLKSDAGNASMTSPSTLSSFIKYCSGEFPANRNLLIFWDHGGGSISGYGYDERFTSSGSMTLQGIQQALKDGGVKFDFIGFDACLMATAENALMLDSYADYLIASEETEPGIGWYYTNWVSSLSANTSVSTLQLGRQIADDFVSTCASRCAGQKATLSVIDLAELAAVLPDSLKEFSEATTEMIKSDGFSQISGARSSAREFSTSSKIDQVDLVSFAQNIATEESEALAKAVLGAVKYNRTSSNMTDAYGLSIYFPYKNASYVKTASGVYSAIGIDSSYTDCVRAYASMQSAGQSVSYQSSPYQSLSNSFGSGYSGYGSSYSSGSGSSGYYSSPSSSYGTDALSALLQSLFSGSSNYAAYGRSLNTEDVAEYLSEHYFDATRLEWTKTADGSRGIFLTQEDWALVTELELSLYYDDGTGYIDLGLDNIFSFTDDGALSGTFDGTWLAINGQPVAYYHLDTVDDGVNYAISGRVPVLWNGDRADLLLVFDNDAPYGRLAGITFDYRDGETETCPKAVTELSEGDTIDFLCDYYTYSGEYSDSYMLGDQMVYDGTFEISNVYLPDESAAVPMYCFTDAYSVQYWTPAF